jgi:hypothetical protein
MSREAELDAACRRKREVRVIESREDCEKRRRLDRERVLARRSNETDDQLKARRNLSLERIRKRRNNETNEHREIRNRKRRDVRQCLKLNNNKGFSNLRKLKKRRLTKNDVRYVIFNLKVHLTFE